MKFIVLVLLLGSAAIAQLPDAPQPQKEPKFFSYRTWQDPPLRTNKQVFTDWTYLLPMGSCGAAMVTDVLVTHGAREQFHSEAFVPLAIAGFGYVSHRLLWAPFTVGMGAYCTQHYVRDAFK